MYGVYATIKGVTVLKYVYSPGEVMKVFMQNFSSVADISGDGIRALYKLANASYIKLGHSSIPATIRIAHNKTISVESSIYVGMDHIF